MTVHYFPGCEPDEVCPSRATLTKVAPGRTVLDLHGAWQYDLIDAAEAFAKAQIVLLRNIKNQRQPSVTPDA
jgi:hypothetical protein